MQRLRNGSGNVPDRTDVERTSTANVPDKTDEQDKRKIKGGNNKASEAATAYYICQD